MQNYPPLTCIIRSSSKKQPDALFVAISLSQETGVEHFLIHYDCERRAYVTTLGQNSSWPDLETFIFDSKLKPLTRDEISN